jgi:hypothetical protein
MPRVLDPVKLESRTQRLFGCAFDVAVTLNETLPLNSSSSKARLYSAQRIKAAVRGIEWRISFPEWLTVWMDSGHWADRGVGRGRYCMARHGDTGPYSVSNVSIQLCTTNSRDGIAKARANTEAKGKTMNSGRLGSGRGWTYVARAALHPFQVTCRRKYIGNFATQQEAEAAYAAAVVNESGLSTHAHMILRSPEIVCTRLSVNHGTARKGVGHAA